MFQWLVETFTADTRTAAWNALAVGAAFFAGVCLAAACGSFVMFLFWRLLGFIFVGEV